MPQRKLPSLNDYDWEAIEKDILSQGYGRVPRVLDLARCMELIALYDHQASFRKRIVMEQHNFGLGEYSYFSYPLPKIVAHLRTELYRHLAPIANGLMHALRVQLSYPPTLKAFQKQCWEAGQTRPTPLMLRYDVGGFNCLHRDLYGETVFPLQAMIVLNHEGQDFTGGEFVLVENRPRQQARALVLHPHQGDLVIFPVSDRPIQGKRGILRASMRHGVSPIVSGQRWVLGIIFHDAA